MRSAVAARVGNTKPVECYDAGHETRIRCTDFCGFYLPPVYAREEDFYLIHISHHYCIYHSALIKYTQGYVHQVEH